MALRQHGPSGIAAHSGLSSREAAERLRRHGPNLLPAPRPPAAWREFLRQLTHFFALMLWIAGGLAILAGMPQLGIAIFLVILVNGIFAFLEEYRSQRTAEHLRALLPQQVTVVRDGLPSVLDARELVEGDLVQVQAGNRICADVRVLEAHGLRLDLSTLTGESLPVAANAGDLLYAGTTVVEGEAMAVAEATGARTRLAGIASLTRAGRRPPSPLAQELSHVVRVIASIALALGAAFFATALLVGIPLSDGFLFALGVTVALVPEGLLPTVTLSLARGARLMATRNALVRRLESVETLGSTTFICTDKTGTLTCNQMSAIELWTPSGRVPVEGEGYRSEGRLLTQDENVRAAAVRLAEAAALGVRGRAVLLNGQWIAQGDPLEAALDVLARRAGGSVALPQPGDRRYPFDPQRRRSSILRNGRLTVRGAPESILPHCTDPHVKEAEAVLDRMASRGWRVIAVAERELLTVPDDAPAGELERNLHLIGLIAVADAPRPGAAASIAACREAGIRLAMVTGDHPATALAVAREVGLSRPNAGLLTGADLPDDLDLLGAIIDRDGIVLSRVTPEQKLRIAQALRQRGHVVAMTGDGVNDGPALQAASIGIAMGRSGTDVAREAADLVLLDDDFSTIVAAIEQGRSTFLNIRRFLTYHLTDNVAELAPFVVWALSGGRFPLALGVLQILCLDLGTDILPGLALGAEPAGTGLLRRAPIRGHIVHGPLLFRVFAVLGPAEAVLELCAFLAAYWGAGWRPGAPFSGGTLFLQASGAAFASVVLGQAANAFACRSSIRWPGRLGWFSHPMLLAAVAVELVALAGFLYIPAVASILGQSPPGARGGLVALLAFPGVLAVDWIYKYMKAARQNGAEPA